MDQAIDAAALDRSSRLSEGDGASVDVLDEDIALRRRDHAIVGHLAIPLPWKGVESYSGHKMVSTLAFRENFPYRFDSPRRAER